MVWAIISSQSCFCWLYRASTSLAAKNIINLTSVLTIYTWHPCVECSLVLLEEGVCYQFSSVTQLCPTLCDHINHSMPGLPVGVGVLTSSWSSPKLMSIELVMASSHPILCPLLPLCPFSSCPHSLPASGSFPMSQLFTWGGQSTGVSASASVLPVNTQDWSPSEWTGCISLLPKGLSRVFSNTTVQKHQFFSAQPSSQSNSHIHTWPLEKPLPWLEGWGKVLLVPDNYSNCQS